MYVSLKYKDLKHNVNYATIKYAVTIHVDF